MKEIVLVSGGIDSAYTLALARRESKDVLAVHYNYGQPTEKRELENAKKLCKYYKVPLVVKDLHEVIPKGGLTDKKQKFTIPTEDSGVSTGYVPFRNALLILIGAGVGASIEKKNPIRIWLGAQAFDYNAYADCRTRFFKAMETCLNLSMDNQTFYISTPIILTDKTDIIREGTKLGVPFNLTYSCYKPINNKVCGKCGACEERIKAFYEAGIKDPLYTKNEWGKILKELDRCQEKRKK